MNLRFSRSSLNLIIFTCIILIGWASIDKNRSIDAFDEPISKEILLPALPDFQYQTWASREGVQVIWQTRLDTEFLIRIRGRIDHARPAQYEEIDSAFISWQPNFWQLDLSLGPDFEQGLSMLSQQLQDFPISLKQHSGSVILQGPWSNSIAKLTSARIINSLQLQAFDSPDTLSTSEVSPNKPLPSSARICPWQPVSAQFWLQDQLNNKNLSQPNMKLKHWQVTQWPLLSDISQQSLQIWKQTFVQQWQSNWLNPTMQFDILADLAYYRLPKNYLLQGYWGINTLDAKQLQAYLEQCSAPEQSPQ